MTRRSNARLAGAALLLYIVFGIATMIITSRAYAGQGIAAKIASIAQHLTDARIATLFILLTSFCAIVLGVTLWAITRDEDPDLAMLGLVCRVSEGLFGAIAVKRSLGLLWLATASGTHAPTPEGANAVGAILYWGDGGGMGSVFFGVGSLLFS